MNLKGKIIVIEGTDGSGKQTQAKMLKEHLLKEGYVVYSNSFPNYASDSSAAVKMYLNGEIKPKAEDVSAKAASIFYAVDRYITYKKEMEPIYESKEQVIVLDRYAASNIIHQGAKLMSSNNDEEELEKFIFWLDNLEHKELQIPEADITIYLDVPVDYTIKLRQKRANKITGKDKQDIHEADESHLKNASKAGRIAASSLGWHVIDCVNEQGMRTIEDIANEIWAILVGYAN